MNQRLLLVIAAIAAAIFLQACASSTSPNTPAASGNEVLAPLVERSGTYSRPISTDSATTQQYFDQGIRFAWGFYFPESIASHQEAARHDPDHPMPYWGMAHAMGPNPNSRYARMPDDPLGEGLKAIKMALERIDRANEVERELINALYVRYDKESISDDHERDLAYLARMRSLNEKYPQDPDIAALFADSYMAIGRWDYWDIEGRAKPGTTRVALALERALKTNPGHPGALHLHIHLIEASLNPERALASADALEATVPIAGHVVHMPAHIYVRVGQYEKAISSNVRSQQVDKEFAAIWEGYSFPNIGTYPLSHKIHAPHAIDFIRYAATVQGNYKVAIDAANASAGMVKNDEISIHAGQKRLTGPWLVYKIFGKWDQLLGKEPSQSGTPYLDGIWAYSIGSAYAATGDIAKAEAELAKLEKIANAPNADEYRVGASPASAILAQATYGLTGEIEQAKGNFDAAIAAFSAGVAIEDQNNYTEPPDWAQPMRHYLGAVMLEAGLAVDAEAVYRRDLRWNQNNGWAVFGLYQALKMQGKEQEAKVAYAEYQTSWQNSDVKLARSRL
jgi:tetratricopeptide (TPR) repeat protein